MLKFLDALPLSGWKTGLSIVIGILIAGAQTLGYIDMHTADLITHWDEILFGIGVTHKVMKISDAVVGE